MAMPMNPQMAAMQQIAQGPGPGGPGGPQQGPPQMAGPPPGQPGTPMQPPGQQSSGDVIFDGTALALNIIQSVVQRIPQGDPRADMLEQAGQMLQSVLGAPAQAGHPTNAQEMPDDQGRNPYTSTPDVSEGPSTTPTTPPPARQGNIGM